MNFFNLSVAGPPEEAEDAQPILGDTLVGIADEPDTPGDQVRITADRVMDPPA